MTVGHDISSYEAAYWGRDRPPNEFDHLHDRLTAHGFRLRPADDARAYALDARATFAPAMEFLIDDLVCPRGFWSIDSTVQAYSSRYDLDRVD